MNGVSVVPGAGRAMNRRLDLNRDGPINTGGLTDFLGRFGRSIAPDDHADIRSGVG